MFLAFEFMVTWCSENIPKPLRILFAIFIGVIIYMTTERAHSATQSGTMFAEMFHALGDIVEILAYTVALLTVGTVGRLVGKVSGGLVLIGGLVPLYKVWHSVIAFSNGENYIIRDIGLFVTTSIVILVLTFFQIILTAHEHGEDEHHSHDHSHQHDRKHVHDSHSALMTHFWSDILMIMLALLLTCVMIIFPQRIFLAMFLDILFTSIIGLWMIKRGWGIVIRKTTH